LRRAEPSAFGRDPRSNQRSQNINNARISTDLADQRDERAIVDAVLAGDRDAFRHLVDRESASVVRACHRVLGDLHEAEDAAQEAFVTAYRSLASWRGDGPFGAWLTRIAVRIALRQAGKRRAVSWLDPSTTGDGSSGDAASVAATSAGGRQDDPPLLASGRARLGCR
jgi:RNA polymerase sigma-70 factor (ECF subfamily)